MVLAPTGTGGTIDVIDEWYMGCLDEAARKGG